MTEKKASTDNQSAKGSPAQQPVKSVSEASEVHGGTVGKPQATPIATGNLTNQPPSPASTPGGISDYGSDAAGTLKDGNKRPSPTFELKPQHPEDNRLKGKDKQETEEQTVDQEKKGPKVA